MPGDGRFKKGIHYSPATEFKKGIHYSRKTEFKKGELGPKSPRYNHGLSYFKRDKRWFIFCRDKTKISFARAIVEGYTKKKLLPGQIIHHKNHCPTDDRIENLEILTRAEHLITHDPLEKRYGKRTKFEIARRSIKRKGVSNGTKRS